MAEGRGEEAANSKEEEEEEEEEEESGRGRGRADLSEVGLSGCSAERSCSDVGGGCGERGGDSSRG